MLIFQFFLDTGDRVNEVVAIDVDDVHLKDGWAKVFGKGKRERILPLGKTLERELGLYLSSIREMVAEEDESPDPKTDPDTVMVFGEIGG